MEIILQLRAVIGMDAVREDSLCPLTWRQIADVGKAVFCNQHIYIMFRMVGMGSEWHDTGNPSALGGGFGDEYGELRISAEITRSADTIHHFGP